jgi:UDP-glucose 4-epimerase
MSHSEKYFIIGGGGFMGGAFAGYLENKGLDVKRILRGDLSGQQETNTTGADVQYSEYKNIIIDFAYTSIPGTSFSDPIKDFSENLSNVNTHLAFANRLPNATYIHISSGGTVYGNVAKKQPVSEEHSNTPLSPYGITKLACEKYTLMYNQVYNLDTKIVRPANIYGPGQKPYRGQGFIPTAIAKIIKGERIQLFGGGSAIRDYLYIDDFCHALFAVITKGENGHVYNVGSEQGLSLNELVEIIARTISLKYDLELLPARPFDVEYNVLDCSKVRQIAPGYDATGISEGVNGTYHWLQEFLANNKAGT